MKRTIRDALLAEPTLTAIVPASRWYAAGNVVDNPPDKPFVVLRWLAPVPLAGGRFAKQLRVDVHEARGSYTLGRQVLGSPDTGEGVYGVLSGLVDYAGVDAHIAQCDYLGHSGDQEDATYNTNFQFQSWQVIGVEL